MEYGFWCGMRGERVGEDVREMELGTTLFRIGKIGKNRDIIELFIRIDMIELFCRGYGGITRKNLGEMVLINRFVGDLLESL